MFDQPVQGPHHQVGIAAEIAAGPLDIDRHTPSFEQGGFALEGPADQLIEADQAAQAADGSPFHPGQGQQVIRKAGQSEHFVEAAAQGLLVFSRETGAAEARAPARPAGR